MAYQRPIVGWDRKKGDANLRTIALACLVRRSPAGRTMISTIGRTRGLFPAAKTPRMPLRGSAVLRLAPARARWRAVVDTFPPFYRPSRPVRLARPCWRLLYEINRRSGRLRHGLCSRATQVRAGATMESTVVTATAAALGSSRHLDCGIWQWAACRSNDTAARGLRHLSGGPWPCPPGPRPALGVEAMATRFSSRVSVKRKCARYEHEHYQEDIHRRNARCHQSRRPCPEGVGNR